MPEDHTDLPRVVALEGGCNFRDLGGYRTVDGRVVRHGRLFRSGVMAYFTAVDCRRVAELGIRTICDLRRAGERTNEPTGWAGESVRVLCYDDLRDRSAVSALAAPGTADPEGMRAAMLALYRGMPGWLKPRLASLFAALAAGEVPLLFHCSAGKDRTGLAAALLLELLGVPRETVLADYTFTNRAVDLERFVTEHRQAALGLADVDHPLLHVPAPARRALLKADADYLAAALAAIESEAGSVGAWLEAEVGVDAPTRERLRAMLLRD